MPTSQSDESTIEDDFQNMSISSNEYFDLIKHHRVTLKTMMTFFRNEQFTDVSLITDDGTYILTHRLVLLANSEFFVTLFTNNPTTNEIQITNIEHNILLALVEYCYTGYIDFQVEHLDMLFTAASKLKLNLVIEAGCEFLIKRLDPRNCLQTIKIAVTKGLANLACVAQSYALAHFVDVVKTKEFLFLTAEQVAVYLASEDVNVPSEETIFNALTTWVQHDLQNRCHEASKLVSCVKFPLLSPTFIYSHITNNTLFADQQAVKDLILEALTYHAIPEQRSHLQSIRTIPRKSTVNETLLFIGDTFINGFSLKENTWQHLLPMSGDRTHFGVVTLETQLLIIGGSIAGNATNTVSSFDFLGLSWNNLPEMNMQRKELGVARLGKSVYAVGGRQGDTFLNTVEKWDSVSEEWSIVAPMLTCRSAAGVAVLNNILYAVGGVDGSTQLSTVECYNPETNNWNFCAPLAKPRMALAVGVLNGCLYALGGLCGNNYSNSVERYDPNDGKWTMVAPMNVARAFFGVDALANRLFAAGGHDNSKYSTLVETYNPLFNRWQIVASLDVGRAGHCGVLKNSAFSTWINSSIRNTD